MRMKTEIRDAVLAAVLLLLFWLRPTITSTLAAYGIPKWASLIAVIAIVLAMLHWVRKQHQREDYARPTVTRRKRKPAAEGTAPQPDWRYYHLHLYIVDDIRGEKYARGFLALLQKYGPPYTGKKWQPADKPGKVKFDLADIEAMLTKWREDAICGFSMQTDRPKEWGELYVFWDVHTYFGGRKDYMTPPNVWMMLAEDRIQSQEDTARLISLIKEMFVLLKGTYAIMWLQGVEDPPSQQYPLWPTIFRSLHGIRWMTIFDKQYVDMFGKDKVLSAPCHRVEELPGGGALLLVTPTAEEMMTDEGRRKAEAVKDHLGRQYFVDPKSDWKPGEHDYRQRPTPDFDILKMPDPNADGEYVFMDIHEIHTPDPEGFMTSVPSIVDNLKTRLSTEAGKLDCSLDSLKIVDAFLQSKYDSNAPYDEWCSDDVLKELAAYSGEVARHESKGTWQVAKDGEDAPAPLIVAKGKGRPFDPVASANEVLTDGISQGELLWVTVAHWLHHGEPRDAWLDKLLDEANNKGNRNSSDGRD